MQDSKSVRFEDVENMMEQIMQVPIFRVSEKRKMLSAWNSSNDPNLIMDLRHKTVGESLPATVSQSCAVHAELSRMLMDEETRALYRKQKEDILEFELKKFEKDLCVTRPKFRGPYTCGKRKILLSDDYEELWKVASQRTENKMKKIERTENSQCNNEEAGSYNGSIKITIKDKPTTGCKERDLEILRNVFQIFVDHAKEERRLRDLKIKIQENVASRRLRRYFDIWKTILENSKRLSLKRKQEREMSDERKIELFVNAINEKQKKFRKRPKEFFPRVKEPREIDKTVAASSSSSSRKNSASRSIHVVEPPAQNRLNAQKRIIVEQKIKLAEQNRIIEELRLKQIEVETKKADRDTMNVAKEALAYCGRKTRRIFMQLMREEGCRDKTLLLPPRIPSPPRFLARMEARAEARRERVKRAEEERKRKLEEQKMKKEIERREEEETRKRLQLEAQREVKRIREEQERKRLREIERSKATNELADKFYRKYLLQRYIMEPFALLIELKHNRMNIAVDHFDRSLLRKILVAWKTETDNQREIKMELSISVWRRNLLWYAFGNWREAAKAQSRKAQVATDFYEMRLQERCMKMWCKRTMEEKIRDLENQQLANCHIERRWLSMCFMNWKKFVDIADEVKESDRRREQWRELVQRVVPDFDPKQRGVIIDD